MKSLCATLLFSTFCLALSAQTFWVPVAEQELVTQSITPDDILPDRQVLVEMNLPDLRSYLAEAPHEKDIALKESRFLLNLMFADQTMHTVRLVESPNMAPELSARFPMIRSFAVQDIDNPLFIGRFDISPRGWHGTMKTDQGTMYVQPVNAEQPALTSVFYFSDYTEEQLAQVEASCGYQPERHDDVFLGNLEHLKTEKLESRTVLGEPVQLKTYKTAVACTGEFGSRFGGTVPTVLAAINTAMNRVNEITVSEVAVKFELVDRNDELLFFNSGTDPFINSNVGRELLGQNTTVIRNIIPFNSFDVGHVFTNRCTDVGGVVSGLACTDGKARGVTCHASTNLVGTAERIMAHELAHQFSVSHSWNNCPGSDAQLASGWAYEPGSGTTIMSYAGACGPSNVQFNEDSYYHTGSIFQFQFFINNGLGTTCGTSEPITNTLPEIDWTYRNGFFIPQSTPFELATNATDMDGDELTYCWEQYDLGPSVPLGSPINNSPLFRSYPPRENNNRYLPRLNVLLTNGQEDTEILPFYERDVTFRCTVRDNRPEGGGTVWEEVRFKATEEAGPFRVTAPNTATDVWTAGDHVEVTWDVANTDQAPVNTKWVDIRLSTDGGFTYPIMLLEHTPNDGSEFITVPDITATSARIRIDAEKNIYFDISNFNFDINPADSAFAAMTTSPTYQQVCAPALAEVELQTLSLNGYDSLLTFSIGSTLPAGVTADFSTNPVTAGQTTTLVADFTNANADGQFPIEIIASAPGQPDIVRTVVLTVVNNDFTAFALDEPTNGATGVSQLPTFTWSALPNADDYIFEIATNPAFGNSTVDFVEGLNSGSYIPAVILDESQDYYWRARPRNVCADSDYTQVYAFSTAALDCNTYTTTEGSKAISASGLPKVPMIIDVTDDGVINDLNITQLKGQHLEFIDLKGYLIGPNQDTVILFDNITCRSSTFDLGFDDQAPFEIPCPPTGGIYKAQESLDAFNGLNTNGVWTLVLEVIDDFGSGGLFQTWSIEFCAAFNPANPALIINETMPVAPGQVRSITPNFLSTEDVDSEPSELEYKLVTLPQNGMLFFNGTQMPIGGIFRQSSINAGNVWYEHSGNGSLDDNFTFTVNDGAGGFLATPQFNIVIDTDAPVGTAEEELKSNVNVFPNPADAFVNVEWKNLVNDRTVLNLIDVSGKVLATFETNQAAGAYRFPVKALPSGVYFTQITNGNTTITKRVVVD